MSPPDSFLGASWLLPRGAPYAFRLDFGEPRLSLAITTGSRSMQRAVPVYARDLLDAQLDATVRRCLGVVAISDAGAATAATAAAAAGGGGGGSEAVSTF